MACGGYDTLFVADGGYITCSLDRCPDPGAVADWLERPAYHTLRLGPDGWAMQHEVTCFPDLTACELHAAASNYFDGFTPPEAWYGLYRFGLDDAGILRILDHEGDDR